MKHPQISLIAIYNTKENPNEFINALIEQSFSDMEIICICNTTDEKAREIIQNTASKKEKIKLLNLPDLQDELSLKQAGLGVAEGDFICFLKQNEIISRDFVKDLYIASISGKKIELKENHLYRRTFLENDEEITQLTENSIKFELDKYFGIINQQKNTIKDEFNKFYQSNIETIKNSNYELTCRFNQLEKLFYEKDFQNNLQIKDYINSLKETSDNDKKQIYNDISKVYEYITSEINQKGSEINKVYEEITKNYHYTEQLISDKSAEFSLNKGNDNDAIWKKLNELEKEISFRYSNIKHLLDNGLDEIKSGVNSSLSPSKFITDNIDKIYSRINDTSVLFYKELSDIYKELNEKLAEENKKNKYYTDTKISELRDEFNLKIQELKEELGKQL